MWIKIYSNKKRIVIHKAYKLESLTAWIYGNHTLIWADRYGKCFIFSLDDLNGEVKTDLQIFSQNLSSQFFKNLRKFIIIF